MRFVLILSSALFAAGCDRAWQQQPTQFQWDPAGDFWQLPMPSDLRTEADGTWNIDRWPGDWQSDMLGIWFNAGNEVLQGRWGLSSAVFITATGTIDPASLPASPEASLAAGASVFIVDIDPDSPDRGRRFPVAVEFDGEGDAYVPANILSAMPEPGFLRRPNTRYAMVVTDAVKDGNGAPLGRSKAFHEAFEGIGASDASENIELLRQQLEFDGVDPNTVVAAAMFTTADPDQLLTGLAAWAKDQAAPELNSPWQLHHTQYEDRAYDLYTSTIAMPRIQLGEPPFARADEGRIAFDTNGQPIIQRHQEMRLILAVPRTPAPAEGYPLTIYAHGSGGEWMQVIERGPKAERDDAPEPEPGLGPAEWLARRGVASLGFDFPLHGARHDPPDTTGLVLYNLTGNAAGTIHNFSAAAMELTLLTRTMIAGPLARAEGEPLRFDPARLSGMGQSMGSTIGVSWAAIDTNLKGIVLSGSGGSMVEIGTSAVEPFDVPGLLQVFLQPGRPIHRHHPVIHALQNVWDMVDPVAKAHRLVRDPYPGVPAKDVMMPAGVTDGYFSPRAEAALAVNLGAPHVGEEVEPYLPWAMRLSGVEPVSYPVQNNLNGKTAAVVQYAADNTKGHYVLFNQEGARHQYTCFLASVGSVGGAKLGAAGAIDDPCP